MFSKTFSTSTEVIGANFKWANLQPLKLFYIIFDKLWNIWFNSEFVCVIFFKTSDKCQMSKTIDKIYIVYLIYDKTD